MGRESLCCALVLCFRCRAGAALIVMLIVEECAFRLAEEFLHVPYHQKYPNEVPRPARQLLVPANPFSRHSSCFSQLNGAWIGGGGWDSRTESDGEIKDEAPAEHLRAVSVTPCRDDEIWHTPVMGLTIFAIV